MMNFDHLDTLQARLGREKDRLAKATTVNEVAFRQREIAACEREIASEYKFLGIEPLTLDEILMSDDDLLAELLK